MVIFSDLHAHNFTGITDNRLQYIKEALCTILQRSRDTDKIALFCGDIVHKHGYIPIEVLDMFIEVFNEYKDVNIYAISGNHDQAHKNYLGIEISTTVKSFANLFSNFHCIDYSNIVIGDYTIWGIPYMQRSDDFYKLLNLVPKHTHLLLLAHQTPTRLFNSFIPADIDIDREEFKKFEYVFMGHIHQYQDFGNNVYMVGNPLIQDESDYNDTKGYLELLNGKITRHIIESDLSKYLKETKAHLKVIADKEQKEAVNIDVEFYSDNLENKLKAYANAIKLDTKIIETGLELIK